MSYLVKLKYRLAKTGPNFKQNQSQNGGDDEPQPQNVCSKLNRR